VDFINPELSNASKIDLIRVSIPNPQSLIRPGMLAYISISNDNNTTLAVPASAVLTSGKGSSVWIKNSDGSFLQKMVTTGSGNQTYLPVISGLSKGDIVVIKAVPIC
jgi:Cu(I)/Ag(I) efflux system membrane fusion protein